MTLRFGGLVVSEDNIKNQEAFGYLIDAPSAFMFGAELYPSVWLKAAIYIHSIICGHIFHDGNKRTALESALLFLEKNNVVLNDNVTSPKLINFAVGVASNCEMSLESIAEWFKQNTYSIGFISPNYF